MLHCLVWLSFGLGGWLLFGLKLFDGIWLIVAWVVFCGLFVVLAVAWLLLFAN